MALPWLTVGKLVLGNLDTIIAVVKPANEPLRPAERALLEDLAGNAGPALHNVLLAGKR